MNEYNEKYIYILRSIKGEKYRPFNFLKTDVWNGEKNIE